MILELFSLPVVFSVIITYCRFILISWLISNIIHFSVISPQSNQEFCHLIQSQTEKNISVLRLNYCSFVW